LKKLIDSGEKFYLVDVLSLNSFEAYHVPKSINIPLSGDFVKEFEQKTKASKDDKTVVYCSSETCGASPQAYKKLKEAGYENAVHFKGGLAGWKDAGYKLEGEASE
jgi:adenylyltransferase/sulfurtransferase